ncbi:MAG TPA: polysaccharide biosynthesis C-terminal domain-containing protein [Candidatus Kapabacteria bacterium]|nr:polysaccharide biosynthesis C-terminal domain-containing protein [Candidatus Kapabacteria bacterium]
MRLSDHLSKVTWSLADKVLYLIYGFVTLMQVSAMIKEEFGVFTIFNQVFSMLFALSDGYILQAVVKFGVDEKQRKEVVTYTFLAHALFVTVVALGLWVSRWGLADVLHEPRYIDVLTAMPLLCVLTIPRTYGLKFFQMLIRTREIFYIDLALFGTMGIVTGYRIYTHTLHTANDLISINIIGAIVGSIVAILLAAPHVRFQLRKEKGLLRIMASFGFYQGSAVLTYILQQQADVIIIQYFSNAVQVANYNSAKIFYRAFEAVRDAVINISYPAVARLHTQERFAELRTIIEKMMSFILLAMIPVVLFCELGGTSFMFHLFFGAKYNDSIPIFNVLALFGLLLPFTLNFNVLTGLGESRAILRIVVISSFVSVVSNFILVPQFQAIGAAFTLILASIVSGALATLAVKKSVPFEWSALYRGIDDGMRFLKRRLRRS